MQGHQAGPGWQIYVVMAIVFVVVFAIRGRALMRVRPLEVERLWVIPILYLVIVGVLFVQNPPSPLGWAIAATCLVIGGAIGWQRGKTTRIHVDPVTGTLMQRGSMWAFAIIIALIATRMIAREEARALHFNAYLVLDGLAALSLGVFAVQRLEMYLRAKALLAASPA